MTDDIDDFLDAFLSGLSFFSYDLFEVPDIVMPVPHEMTFILVEVLADTPMLIPIQVYTIMFDVMEFSDFYVLTN